jgi:hypothetical protein
VGRPEVFEIDARVAIQRRNAEDALRKLHCYKSMAETFRVAE